MVIPKFYVQLLSSAGSATLSVLSKDGSIQSTLVWPDYDGEFIKLNMMDESPKARNIQREGKATILMSHGSNETLYISVRCELHEISKTGAIDHLDSITQRNMGVEKWYGDVFPSNRQEEESRVIVYLKPVRVYHT